MELPVSRERWAPATSAANQPHPERRVIGCKIPQDMSTPYFFIFGTQTVELVRDYRQLVRRSPCVIRCGSLQGFAILTGQLST